jgi:hypothetical protein
VHPTGICWPANDTVGSPGVSLHSRIAPRDPGWKPVPLTVTTAPAPRQVAWLTTSVAPFAVALPGSTAQLTPVVVVEDSDVVVDDVVLVDDAVVVEDDVLDTEPEGVLLADVVVLVVDEAPLPSDPTLPGATELLGDTVALVAVEGFVALLLDPEAPEVLSFAIAPWVAANATDTLPPTTLAPPATSSTKPSTTRHQAGARDPARAACNRRRVACGRVPEVRTGQVVRTQRASAAPRPTGYPPSMPSCRSPATLRTSFARPAWSALPCIAWQHGAGQPPDWGFRQPDAGTTTQADRRRRTACTLLRRLAMPSKVRNPRCNGAHPRCVQATRPTSDIATAL